MRISIRNLSKTYPRGSRALRDVSLDIGGGIFGLLGPNGAGKTTLMNILVTLLKPTGGTVTIDGYDLRRNRAEIRALLGFLPQELDVFPNLKTLEFLDYSARLAGMMNGGARKRAVNEMLERVRLSDERDRRANDLSGGMKRRLGIAQALIGGPRLLVVDEPTAGLDPEERLRFRSLLAELGGADVTVILSTHIVGDISSTCRDMALLHRGEIVYRGSPDGLVEKTRGHVWLVKVHRSEMDALKERYLVVTTVPIKDSLEVQVVADQLEGYSGTPIEPNLEHAYVYFYEFVLGR
jgi:ABC-type multidrug transport system ATPase subunit